MMRKMFRKKRRSCWCKPNKVGADCRWTAKERAAYEEFDRIAEFIVRNHSAALERLAEED